MELWTIAVIAGVVLVAALAYLATRRRRRGAAEWDTPRNSQPWDARPVSREDSQRTSIPPSGIFTGSEEMSGSLQLESQELYLFDDDEPTGPIPRILVEGAGASVANPKGGANEDAWLVSSEHEVYVVADGMGGYAAGEVASSILVEAVREAFETMSFGSLEPDIPRRAAELVAAIEEAHRRIRAEAERDSGLRGMGTTVVSVRVSPRRKRVYIAHVGDSRCYRVRDGKLTVLTADHTLGALGIEGKAAKKLSRAVGVFEEVDVDLRVDEPREGDFYLLCSDGLHKHVPDDEIVDAVTSAPTADAVRLLVDAARERGSRDDVTAVLIRVDEPTVERDQSGAHRLPV